jgi:hypothetical protein
MSAHTNIQNFIDETYARSDLDKYEKKELVCDIFNIMLLRAGLRHVILTGSKFSVLERLKDDSPVFQKLLKSCTGFPIDSPLIMRCIKDHDNTPNSWLVTEEAKEHAKDRFNLTGDEELINMYTECPEKDREYMLGTILGYPSPMTTEELNQFNSGHPGDRCFVSYNILTNKDNKTGIVSSNDSANEIFTIYSFRCPDDDIPDNMLKKIYDTGLAYANFLKSHGCSVQIQFKTSASLFTRYFLYYDENYKKNKNDNLQVVRVEPLLSCIVVGEEDCKQELEHKKMALGKVYIDHGGDLERITDSIGVEFKKDAIVHDPQDFAKKFLKYEIQK